MSNIKSSMFYHPLAFWLGCAAITFGVVSHFPMFIHAAPMGFHMAGMPMSTAMLIGMGLIPIGLIFSSYGLFPGKAYILDNRKTPSIQIHISDSVPLNIEHWKLVFVLFVAVAVDVMKPATLGFVMPGLTREYGISKAAAGSLVLIALSGTAVGSVIWGIASDKFGRRATILLSALMFIGTAICGAMPSFKWNLIMCFLMGLSAGGLLPITFALMAETVPARHRGWLLVALGGFGTSAGYLLASGAAALLEPHYSWRSLWLLGLPTGLAIILLNKYIPESPRYLVRKGLQQEARQVLARFSPNVNSQTENVVEEQVPIISNGMRELLQGRYALLSIGLIIAGLAWGIVNFGFLLWLPTNLRELGYGHQADVLIAQSAVVALPGIGLVIALYHWWSSIYAVIAFLALTVISLLVFCFLEWANIQSANSLLVATTLLLTSASGVIAMLIPYASEIYPVALRGTGVGMIAGSSKVGGIIGAVMGVLGIFNNLAMSALCIALILIVSAFILFRTGINTRGLKLEDIQNKLLIKKNPQHLLVSEQHEI